MSELIKRITRVAGQDFDSTECRVKNPHITARESIELADYIVALQAERDALAAQVVLLQNELLEAFDILKNHCCHLLPVKEQRVLVEKVYAFQKNSGVKAVQDGPIVWLGPMKLAEYDERSNDYAHSDARRSAESWNKSISGIDAKHHLAAHDAEVAKKAVQAALRMYGNADLSNKEIMALSENYAASLNK